MKQEERIIKASMMAGITDIAFGIFMSLTGWQEWYFNHFHVFGVLGIGMLAYGYWHKKLYEIETGVDVWKKK